MSNAIDGWAGSSQAATSCDCSWRKGAKSSGAVTEIQNTLRAGCDVRLVT